ncbi:MAG: DNA polymerase III subunit [Planctomycetes bacterium]|nr:DNA polymerase III subunit [Planctomycetota bacterium]
MSFAGIEGHEARQAELLQAFESGRVATATLLAGTEGVGKRTLARAFATLLLCSEPTSAGACGTCGSCRACAAGSHPDLLFVVPPDTSRGRIEITQVRDEIIVPLDSAPRLSARRVTLIDGADRFTEAAQHALLKTLEEPPERAFLFLVTPSIATLLPTVLSRCKLLRFGRLPDAVCRAILEREGIPNDHVDRAVRLGDGSPGRALELYANPYFTEEERLLDWIERGLPPTRELRDLLPGLDPTSSPPGSLKDRRDRLQNLFSMLLAELRGLLADAILQEPALPEDEVAARATLVRGVSEACLDAMADLERSVTPELAFETWVERLASVGYRAEVDVS